MNLESTEPAQDSPPELQFQIIPDLGKANSKAKALSARIQNQNSFVLASSGSPSLDFVHDGFLDMDTFQTIPRGISPENNEFYSALVAAATNALEDKGSYLAVFGTGYSDNDEESGTRASFGFSGVDNVHMNQGNYREIGHFVNHHFSENGPRQDGAVLFYFSDGSVQGFFSKFQSQDNETDAHGNPVHTNVEELNAVAPDVAKIVTRGVARRKKRAAAAISAAASATVSHVTASSLQAENRPPPRRVRRPSPRPGGGFGFVFNDPPDSPDPVGQFKNDDDSDIDPTFEDNFAKHGVPSRSRVRAMASTR